MEIEKPKDFKKIFSFLSKYSKTPQTCKRIECQIQQTDRFYLPPSNKNIKPSYQSIYWLRYEQLSKRLQSLSHSHLIDKVQAIKDQRGILQIIGIIFKEMKLKPYYFSKSTGIKNYISNDDSCYLEDSSGRVKLQIAHNCKLIQGNFYEKEVNINDLVTGMVVMIEGQIASNNLISVSKIYLPEMAKPKLLRQIEPDVYICLISGINYSHKHDQTKISELISFLQGNLFNTNLVSKISQIVIAGNLYQKIDAQDCLVGALKMQNDFKTLYQDLQNDIKGIDEFLLQLSRITPVCVMPGFNDPVPHMLPQPPIHKSHFKESFLEGGQIQLLTNPCEFTINDISVIGTSGQNIDDIKKYTQMKENDLELMELTLIQSQIAPTLPDTLISFPIVYQRDPFILDEIPNIYFAGNMKEYGTKLFNDNARIVSLPIYSETAEFCIINLKNLDCHLIKLQ